MSCTHVYELALGGGGAGVKLGEKICLKTVSIHDETDRYFQQELDGLLTLTRP